MPSNRITQESRALTKADSSCRDQRGLHRSLRAAAGDAPSARKAMKSSRRASVIRLLATMVVAMLPAACGSRTPLNYIPTFGDGIDDDDTDSDPDASRDRDAS